MLERNIFLPVSSSLGQLLAPSHHLRLSPSKKSFSCKRKIVSVNSFNAGSFAGNANERPFEVLKPGTTKSKKSSNC